MSDHTSRVHLPCPGGRKLCMLVVPRAGVSGVSCHPYIGSKRHRLIMPVYCLACCLQSSLEGVHTSPGSSATPRATWEVTCSRTPHGLGMLLCRSHACPGSGATEGRHAGHTQRTPHGLRVQMGGGPRLSGEQRHRGRHAGDAQQVPPVGRPAHPLRARAPARIPRPPQLRQRRLRCLQCVQSVRSGRIRRSWQGQGQALIVGASTFDTRPPTLTPPAPPAPPLPPGTHGTGAMAASAVGVAGKGRAVW